MFAAIHTASTRACASSSRSKQAHLQREYEAVYLCTMPHVPFQRSSCQKKVSHDVPTPSPGPVQFTLAHPLLHPPPPTLPPWPWSPCPCRVSIPFPSPHSPSFLPFAVGPVAVPSFLQPFLSLYSPSFRFPLHTDLTSSDKLQGVVDRPFSILDSAPARASRSLERTRQRLIPRLASCLVACRTSGGSRN